MQLLSLRKNQVEAQAEITLKIMKRVFAYYASWSNVPGDVKLFCPRQLLCKSDSNRSFVGAFRACLHGGGGPQVGEVTRLGEVKK